MSDKPWKPDDQKNTPPSREDIERLIKDFPTIREAYRTDPQANHGSLSVKKAYAQGYLEKLLNLSDDERKAWEQEIQSLGDILWVWEHRNDPTQW